MLKVQSVCVGMEAVGESAAVALEVGQVTPSQLGNVCLRQYLSNRSLGKKSPPSVFECVFFLSGCISCMEGSCIRMKQQ